MGIPLPSLSCTHLRESSQSCGQIMVVKSRTCAIFSRLSSTHDAEEIGFSRWVSSPSEAVALLASS
jgi:hypothetical protein